MASRKWENILAAGQAGSMIGDSLGGIGDSIDRGMNGGLNQRERAMRQAEEDMLLKRTLLENPELARAVIQQGQSPEGEPTMRAMPLSPEDKAAFAQGRPVSEASPIKFGGQSLDPNMMSQINREAAAKKIQDQLTLHQAISDMGLKKDLELERMRQGYSTTAQQNLFGQQKELAAQNYEQALKKGDQDAAARYKLEMDKIDKQSGGGFAAPTAGLQPDKTGHYPDVLTNVSPNMSEIVKQLVEYKMKLPSGNALKTPFWQNAIALAGQYDPSFDASSYDIRQNTKKDFATGKSAQNITRLNTAIGHLDTLMEKGKALNNYGGLSTPLNAPSNAVQSFFGDNRQVGFNSTAKAVTGELASVFKNMGATDAEIKSLAQTVNTSQSPAQQKEAIGTYIELLGSRMEALSSQYEKGLGKQKDFRILNDKSRGILKKLGVDPDALDKIGGHGGSSEAPTTAEDYLNKFK